MVAQFKGREAILNGLMGHFRSLLRRTGREPWHSTSSRTGTSSWSRRSGDNVTKAGLRYDNHYCLVFRIENGKIKEIREYCDSTLVERVLGPFPDAQRRVAG